MYELYVVGLGPGGLKDMTFRAREALDRADVIVGYEKYVELIRDEYGHKELVTSKMGSEKERCALCLSRACAGERVALVCSGDPGVYGMASPLLELSPEYPGCSIEIVCAVTAALSGAALLGAPLAHDFCVISLSDLLTPWEVIEKRLIKAAEGDFAIAIYNPASKGRREHLKKACTLLMQYLPEDRVCGIVRNIGRQGQECRIMSLGELADYSADMFTTVFIGASATRKIGGYMVTPRIVPGGKNGKDNTSESKIHNG